MDSRTQRHLDSELSAHAEIAGLTIELLKYEGSLVKIVVSDTIVDTVPVIRMRRLLRFRRTLKIAGHVLTTIRPLHMGSAIVITVRLSLRSLDL